LRQRREHAARARHRTRTRACAALGTFALDEIYNAPLFAGAAAFLFLIAAASAFIPALRATRVDPTESLRNE
jgi:ABC-type lipoprotein release transport system permease subunit